MIRGSFKNLSGEGFSLNRRSPYVKMMSTTTSSTGRGTPFHEEHNGNPGLCATVALRFLRFTGDLRGVFDDGVTRVSGRPVSN